MGFGTGGASQYSDFASKYGLTAGFGGLLDLQSLFGDLVKETSFVRDRVSSSRYLFIFTGSLK